MLGEEELAAQDPKEVQYRITLLEEEMQAMEVDLEAIQKYRAKDGEYAERARELEGATAERDEVRRVWVGCGGGWMDGWMDGWWCWYSISMQCLSCRRGSGQAGCQLHCCLHCCRLAHTAAARRVL